MNLVVVESPSKARTIKKFLGPEFEVTASSGHIKDLPQRDLGVDVENNFAPSYFFIPNKKKFIESIRKLARQADEVYIATDPDREGEAIAAHVAEVIRETHSAPHRALFFEITRNAVQRAITSSGTIDQRKVDAQIARRVVDRLVGYQVSPFIWKTVAKGLSAGRVQSVALRLVCEREEEINGFVPQEYWSIHALFSGAEVEPFWAELVRYREEKVDLPDKSAADAVAAATQKASFEVSAFKKNQARSKPYPPYTTSTLQQDASRRLGFSAKRTMSLAQKLYEGIELADGETTGLITYMRTDSTRIASEAVNSVRGYIRDQIGADFLPEKPKYYSQKKKRTQDAHEAIRPTGVARTPGELKGVLDAGLWKLYDLIWRRFVASQMADTINEVTTVEIAGDEMLFRAKGQKRLFDGFQKIYPLDNNANQLLPTFPEGFGTGYPMVLKDVEGKQHFTQPPPRFTEATLVKALDELGIGRPSTYATIIGTLLDRDYTRSEKRKLIPTKLGETVNRILVELFPKIFEVGFTARMEEQLDLVEEGTPWVDVIGEFYEPFSRTLVEAEEKRRDIKKKVEEVSEEVCEKCGRHMVIKWGRRGRFLACSGFPECRNIRPLEPPQESGKKCPKCGQDLLIKEGRYGRFLGCSNYPSCRHVEPVGTGVTCPEPDCGGELVERSSKKGRFYSCSRYPKCKYRLKSKPEPVACEECGHPFMTHTGGSGERDQLVCPRCKLKIKKVSESENVV